MCPCSPLPVPRLRDTSKTNVYPADPGAIRKVNASARYQQYQYRGTPLPWTYTSSPDLSGKEAALSGSVQVAVKPTVLVPDLFADLEYVSRMIDPIVMTGTNTTNFTAVWYGMKKAMPFDQVVLSA